MQDTVYNYLDQLTELFGTANGLIGLLLGIFLLILLGTIPKSRWFVVAVLLVVSTFGSEASEDVLAIYQYRQLPFPLDAISAHSRLLQVLIALSLLVPLVKSFKGWRTKLLTSPAFSFFLLNMWMCMRLLAETSSRPRGLLSLTSYTLLMLTLVMGIGRSLQTMEDAYAFLKALVGAGVIFVLINLYYVLRNPASAQGRFWGTTSNPQAVGQIVALLLPPLLCLTQFYARRTSQKLFLWAAGGILVIFLLWSGSRTGAITAAIGIAFFYRARIKRAMVGIILGGIVTFVAILFVPQSLVSISRFTDQANSRSGAWANLIDLFQQNPIFGVTFEGVGYGESLYLATLANYGIIGAIPLALFLILITANLSSVYRARKSLGQHSVLVDVFIAEMMMILIASVFESSLLGVWNVVTLMLYLNLAFLGFLKDSIAAVEVGAVEHVETPQLAFGMPMPQV